MRILETAIHPTDIPGAPPMCQALYQPTGGTAEIRGRMPPSPAPGCWHGRALQFCVQRQGPLPCLLRGAFRPPPGLAHLPSHFSFSILHLKIEASHQNLHGLQNAPCPPQKCQQARRGQSFVCSFPLGPGCLCSVSGRPRCEELGIQNTWQQGMRSRPFGKD